MSITEFVRGIRDPQVDQDRCEFDFAAREFDVYSALAALINPVSVLEVGVYCGYSAAAMVHGGVALKHYLGLDAELYHPASNAEAARIMSRVCAEVRRYPECHFVRLDTQRESVDGHLAGRQFDWVHIDAGHEQAEAVRDMVQFWPYVGRVMSVHDVTSHAPVRAAVEEVMSQRLIDWSATCAVESIHGFRLFIK